MVFNDVSAVKASQSLNSLYSPVVVIVRKQRMPEEELWILFSMYLLIPSPRRTKRERWWLN